MAVEMGKVIAKLNEKLKGRSVTKEHKAALAKRWADKIETDEDIDSYVDERLEDILDASRDADRRATEAANKARQDAADAAAGKTPKTDTSADPEPDPTMPAWAKQLLEQNRALQEKISGFEQASTRQTIEQRFKADERLKGIPEQLLKGRIPQSEDQLEAAIEEAKADFAPYLKAIHAENFGGDSPSGTRQPEGGSKTKQATDAELDAVMANLPI